MANSQEVVSKEEFLNWKDNKVTKTITDMLNEVKQANVDYVIAGGTLKEGEYATASIVGLIKGIDMFLDMDVTEDTKESYGH